MKIGFSQIRSDLWMCFPPFVPDMYSLVEHIEMLLICHIISSPFVKSHFVFLKANYMRVSIKSTNEAALYTEKRSSRLVIYFCRCSTVLPVQIENQCVYIVFTKTLNRTFV